MNTKMARLSLIFGFLVASALLSSGSSLQALSVTDQIDEETTAEETISPSSTAEPMTTDEVTTEFLNQTDAATELKTEDLRTTSPPEAGLSAGAIAGIAIGAVAGLALTVSAIFAVVHSKGHTTVSPSDRDEIEVISVGKENDEYDGQNKSGHKGTGDV